MSGAGRGVRSLWLLAAVLAMSVVPAAAQTEQADPLQCWWRTSSGAVRIGETFSVVLTCAVLESDAAKVIVDQSKLEPSVVQLAPFEVTGGSHGADLRRDERRFFQYEYRLRLIAENLFGKDVPLPETKISYHVQSTVAQGAAIQGRDQSYVLPAQSIRLMSLVPADASDIRDTTSETFADVDQRSFRASLLIVIGGVLLALAGLMALLALVRLFGRFRKPATKSDRLVTDSAILGAIGRELKAVQRARDDGGWSPALAGRALGALRAAATYALGQRVAQSPALKSRASSIHSTITTLRSPSAGGEGRDISAMDGQLTVGGRWPGSKAIVVSGSVTPRMVARELARGDIPASRAALLESIEQALTRFTTAQYGRETALDEAGLDESLATGFRVARRLRMEQLSPLKRFGRRRPAAEVATRAWSR
jgi:hypothetical protein